MSDQGYLGQQATIEEANQSNAMQQNQTQVEFAEEPA